MYIFIWLQNTNQFVLVFERIIFNTLDFFSLFECLWQMTKQEKFFKFNYQSGLNHKWQSFRINRNLKKCQFGDYFQCFNCKICIFFFINILFSILLDNQFFVYSKYLFSFCLIKSISSFLNLFFQNKTTKYHNKEKLRKVWIGKSNCNLI